MNLSLFNLRIGEAALVREADELEARLGPRGAVRHVRQKIVRASRMTRPHLYRLHDEIVRRHPYMISA